MSINRTTNKNNTPCQALFFLKWDWLHVCFFWGFLILMLGMLPGMLNLANSVDQKMHGKIRTDGDDHDYQRLAVNFLHGFGFTEAILLPLETYHLDDISPSGKHLKAAYGENANRDQPYFNFYRPPGYPLMLTSTYAIFGNQPLMARRMLAILSWLTAILLLLTGASLAGWLGSIAGGLSGLYFLKYSPTLAWFEIGITYSEIPTAFWVTLFCFLFVIYLKKKNLAYFCLAAIGLACVVFTRANMLGALPFILLYLYLKGHRLKELLIFGMIVILPVMGWSVYASVKAKRLVTITTQGASLFQQCNNIDALKTGNWEPGMELNEQGVLIAFHNSPKPGENGWINGLTFWANNLPSLPRLFYVKLRMGFWYTPSYYHYAGGPLRKSLPPHVYLMGIGFLLLSIGLRQPQEPPRWPKNWSSGRTLALQLALVGLLLLCGNKISFGLVIVLWAAIASIAWFRPYGDYYQLPFPPPTWFLAFIACHAATTLLFYSFRFHWPLDPMLMLFSFLGIGLSLQELLKRESHCCPAR